MLKQIRNHSIITSTVLTVIALSLIVFISQLVYATPISDATINSKIDKVTLFSSNIWNNSISLVSKLVYSSCRRSEPFKHIL